MLAVAATLLVASCSGSDGGSDGGSDDATTTTASPPLALAAAVPAPADTTYVSESSIDTSGYWTGYRAGDGLDLSAYGDRLEVLGWTIGDVDDTSLSATMTGGWLNVAVADDGSLGVCVFNAEPDDGACADFPASLSESATTTTTEG